MLEFFYWEIFYKYMFIKKISKDIFFLPKPGYSPHVCGDQFSGQVWPFRRQSSIM